MTMKSPVPAADFPRSTEAEPGTFFDVTVEKVLGRVLIDEHGGFADTPREAAFRMIAIEGEPGRYSFPLRGGGMCRVYVEHEGVEQ